MGLKLPAQSIMLHLVLASAATAQGVPQEECARVLNSPPIVDVLTRNGGRDFGMLDARQEGRVLVGLECRREDLDRYFRAAGWEFIQLREGERGGPFGGEIRYYADDTLIYCQKGRNVMTLYLRRCIRSARFSLLEGKVSFINVGTSK